MCRFCNKPEHKNFDAIRMNLIAEKEGLAERLATSESRLETCAAVRDDLRGDLRDCEVKLRTCLLESPECEECEHYKPPLNLPPAHRQVTKDELEAVLIRDCGRCQIVMPDLENVVVTPDDYRLYILWAAAYKKLYVVDKRDCEQFTGWLRNAAFGYPVWEEIATWDAHHMTFFGAHSLMVVVLMDEGELRAFVVEPQMNPEGQNLEVLIKRADEYFGVGATGKPWILFGGG
ncbi:MAG: hypothetical protein GF350_00480 [Chitinivibrionales bacterium]|nr:hypothetical protein [Chitinivibrionales bacterium]